MSESKEKYETRDCCITGRDHREGGKELDSGNGSGRFSLLLTLLLRLRAGGGDNPTFSGGKLYEGAELRVPGTRGNGLDSAEPVLPSVLTESLENNPRPELGVEG